ncbi:MAG TPA: pseudouridine synthase, partial [Polyangiales bacterium]|nr:pseudouridine synthase [Polyangiales bacterium]
MARSESAASSAAVAAASAAVRVLHRDAHLLVLEKPSGLPTTGPGSGRTLVDVAHELDPDAPRLHPSSRLDAEVSGIVTFARTPEATQHLLAARKAGRYLRGYLGISAAAPQPASGSWEHAIGIDPRDARKRRVVPVSSAGARPACSLYRVLAVVEAPDPAGDKGEERARGRACALWLEPQTGRTHQLRVHAAHAGVALYGDRPYGGPQRLVLADGSVVTARRTLLH